MNVGRMCSVQGSSQLDTHQRGSEYLKLVCARYHGMGFTSQLEWVGEQMVEALGLLLNDTRCTDDERRAVEKFLKLAAEEVPGAV
ncbi:MAG: hypothetical protein NVS2B16_17320 [Chloroflexota bacterium]